jgi:exocyst complex component 6
VATLGKAREHLRSVVTAKLDDFFELAEYDWTPDAREGSPSMYLYELVNWLTTVLDALAVRENDKDDAYRGAVEHVARSLVVWCCPSSFAVTKSMQAFLTGPNIPMLNENALSNVLVDVDFIDDELKRINRAHLSSSFAELRGVRAFTPFENASCLTQRDSPACFSCLIRHSERISCSRCAAILLYFRHTESIEGTIGQTGSFRSLMPRSAIARER